MSASTSIPPPIPPELTPDSTGFAQGVIPTPPDAGPAPIIEGLTGDVRGYGGVVSIGGTPKTDSPEVAP